MEDIRNKLGSTQNFTSWEVVEENIYRGLNGTLVQKYFFNDDSYKMMGYSVLNGVDISTGETFDNKYMSKVVEEGIAVTVMDFDIESKSKNLTGDLSSLGFNKIIELYPECRTVSHSDGDWNTIEELYEEFYLLSERNNELCLINVTKKAKNKYSVEMNDIQTIIEDATVYRKSKAES